MLQFHFSFAASIAAVLLEYCTKPGFSLGVLDIFGPASSHESLGHSCRCEEEGKGLQAA